MKKALLALGLFFFPAAFVFAQPVSVKNLLQNGTFNTGEMRKVSRWIFPPTPIKNLGTDAEHVEWGGELEADANSVLFIATKAPIKAQLWWQQEVAAQPGAVYTLSVRMVAEIVESAAGRTYSTPDVGIYFLNAGGRWIGYQRLPSPKEFSPEWTPVSMKVTAPDDAVKIGVRLGMSTSAQIKVRFDDAVLTLAP